MSGSHDRTARIWSTDHIQPLRVLAGHLSDVDVSISSVHTDSLMKQNACHPYGNLGFFPKQCYREMIRLSGICIRGILAYLVHD